MRREFNKKMVTLKRIRSKIKEIKKNLIIQPENSKESLKYKTNQTENRTTKQKDRAEDLPNRKGI